ncbi:MAG: hypothetical protein M0T70_09010 [Geobacteraceae bacterium]|nr:hypothetical protein [Geobacteraceae bacterium]
MAFCVFERATIEGTSILTFTGETFSLAGYNLIHEAWQNRGCPLDQGWHVDADELIQLYTAGTESSQTRRLIIDFDPSSTKRFGLIEILDLYAFTWSDEEGKASWTPLMLRMRDVLYLEFPEGITADQKNELLASIKEPEYGDADFVEFLYLNGASNGWNWGRNGMTNAVFLQGAAREYFRACQSICVNGFFGLLQYRHSVFKNYAELIQC